jgi:hypothetical protein
MSDATEPQVALEAQIQLWREHMARRAGVTAVEVDELEDHLRAEVDELAGAGLSDDEAFLVAVKRLGSQHEIAREFARENSQRLWKQLVLDDDAKRPREAGDRGGWVPVVIFALIAALVVKVPALFGLTFDDNPEFYLRNVSLLGLVTVAAYLLWRRRATLNYVLATAAGFAVIAVAANVYPLDINGDALPMTALHVPIAVWVIIGLAYATARWRSTEGRMDYVRFTGEFLIYLVLIQAASYVLLLLIGVVPTLVGIDTEQFLIQWVVPCGAAAAVIVAAWLVEAKQAIVENMAPVLARIFTPLFTLAFLGLLAVVLFSGEIGELNRELLIATDGILVVAVGLILYNLTARGADTRFGWFDWIQLTLVGSALALDAIAFVNIAIRITDGWTFNRAVVLGANVILLVNLVVSAWLLVRLQRGRAGAVRSLETWQTALLPVYGAWALVVVLVLPPVFGLT